MHIYKYKTFEKLISVSIKYNFQKYKLFHLNSHSYILTLTNKKKRKTRKNTGGKQLNPK